MPVTTRRQQAAVVGTGRQPAASRADNTSRRYTKEAEDAAKEHQFIEDVIGTGADRQWHACMADASLVHVHKPHVDRNRMHVRYAHVLCRTCIQLLTTSSSISSSHRHAGDEVVVGLDGEKRVLKPWPQVIATFGLQQ